MIKLYPNKDDPGMGLVLNVSEVFEKTDEYEYPINGQTYNKSHGSGWTITGKVVIDYYTWINDFNAIHPEYGFVRGNFEGLVEVSSMKAYHNFMKHHSPEKFDYQDI
jgi:hypothetical protein